VSENFLKYISSECLLNPERLRAIYRNPETGYYSYIWSPEFYIKIAKAGFIPFCKSFPHLGQCLTPEIQDHTIVLDLKNRHCERSMKRWQRSARFADQKYRLSFDHDPWEIVAGIQKTHGEEVWLRGRYIELLDQLVEIGPREDFRLVTVGLLARDGDLIAGEVGYEVGNFYTSLSGYFDRGNRIDNHAGKLQLHLLAEELENRGIKFWNLCQPPMPYKFQLGAKEIPRAEFLKLWPPFRP